MATVKQTCVFSIGRYYRNCTVWWAKASTREVIGQSRIWFDKGVSIQERYAKIAEWLTRYKIKCPPFEAGRKR